MILTSKLQTQRERSEKCTEEEGEEHNKHNEISVPQVIHRPNLFLLQLNSFILLTNDIKKFI